MSEGDKVFAGSIPELYDTYLVPLIFEAFANDLAGRVAALDPKKILETAAGSGVVTRALIRRLSSDARYTVTDLNQPMLHHAASKQKPDDRIEWRQADAVNLPFDEKSFDVVLCQFGVMFFPDRIAGYAEARRVLKPGGKFIFNVWDDIRSNHIADIVTEAAAAVFPDDPPQFLGRTPYGYHEERLIRHELKQAGLSHVTCETLVESSFAPSPRHAAIAFCQGTPLRNEIESRDATLLHDVTDRAAEAIAARYGTGPVTARIQGHVITATR